MPETPLRMARFSSLAVGLGARLALAGAFALAALRYWLSIFPGVCVQLRTAARRAGAIPDPALRGAALHALSKRGNIEGAAAFAVLAPWRVQPHALRALIAFQALYNYTDALAEQPSADPLADALRLHEALLLALQPSGAHPDHYAWPEHHGDGGYLAGMIDDCRTALARMPSYQSVEEHALDAAERIVAFQSLTLARDAGERDALECWARAQTPPGSGLLWWETAAACGSSMPVLALIAAAGDPLLDPREVRYLSDAYLTSIAALHSLLDSLLDTVEDAATGQLSLVRRYPSQLMMVQRMSALASASLSAARALPGGRRHAVLLAGMVGLYLSDADAGTAQAMPVAFGVRAELGSLVTATMFVFAARRHVAHLARLVRRRPGAGASGDVPPLGASREGADARAA